LIYGWTVSLGYQSSLNTFLKAQQLQVINDWL
jgi:hypothetical protein